MFTEHKIKGTLDLLDTLKGLYRKNERGYRLKPENLRFWTIHIRHLSDVPVSRNWYKTVSKLYQKLWIVCTVGYYVTRTSANSRAVSLSRVSRDQYTALPLADTVPLNR